MTTIFECCNCKPREARLLPTHEKGERAGERARGLVTRRGGGGAREAGEGAMKLCGAPEEGQCSMLDDSDREWSFPFCASLSAHGSRSAMSKIQ